MLYQKKTKNGMILIKQASIETKITPSNLDHYRSVISGSLHINQVITVNVSDLPPQSGKKVEAICPLCQASRVTAFSMLTIQGHSYCQKCKQRLTAYSQYIGQKVGRLTILEFASPKVVSSGGNRTAFRARCDCGHETIVYAQSVKRAIAKNSVLSCGCYQLERIKQLGLSNSGPNNPMYRHDLSEAEKRKLLKKRKLPGQITWRNKIRARDGQCVVCGSTHILEVHHLYDFVRNDSHRREMGNGVTLCREHHHDLHYNFLGNSHKPCTPHVFYAYLSTVHHWSTDQIESLIHEKQLARADDAIA